MRFLLYCILSKKKNPNPQIPEIKQPLASCWTSSWSEAREVVVVHRNTHSSWWFQPTQNLCASRIGSFPQGSGFKTKQIVETTTLIIVRQLIPQNWSGQSPEGCKKQPSKSMWMSLIYVDGMSLVVLKMKIIHLTKPTHLIPGSQADH